MNHYAIYDKDGNILQVLHTTRRRTVELTAGNNSFTEVASWVTDRNAKIVNNDTIKVDVVSSSVLPSFKSNSEKEIIKKEVTITNLKPSEVDTWVDENGKDLDGIKNILKQLLKIHATRPIQIMKKSFGYK